MVIDKNGRAAVVLKATLNRNLKAGTPADLGVCDRGPALLMPTAGGAAVRMAPQEKKHCRGNLLAEYFGNTSGVETEIARAALHTCTREAPWRR